MLSEEQVAELRARVHASYEQDERGMVPYEQLWQLQLDAQLLLAERDERLEKVDELEGQVVIMAYDTDDE